MRNYLFTLIALFFLSSLMAQQELNALVSIRTEQIQSTNKQVYTTLEKAITEFINQTKWTNKNFSSQERINCAFTFVVSQQNNNVFTTSLRVQATRPVYGSSYETPIINTNDRDVTFQYNEYDPLNFNPNAFNGNLVSSIVFYVYTILGVDADTFALKGGQEYFKLAQAIADFGQQSGSSGWENEIGVVNKFTLIDKMLSPKYNSLRQAYYNYHRKGLDTMTENEKLSKVQMANSLISLQKIFNVTIGNNMLRFFLDSKLDEIVKVFSDGVSSGKEQKLKTVLNRIAPTYGNRWKEIKDY